VRTFQPVAVYQAANRVGAKQGRVAVKDQQIAVKIPKQRRDLEDRMRRPELLALNDLAIAWAQMPADFLLAVADHYTNVLRGQYLQCIPHHALEHAPVTQRLGDQRTAVRRPIVFARREHDCSQGGPRKVERLCHRTTRWNRSVLQRRRQPG
jgi:hypothetical protein